MQNRFARHSFEPMYPRQLRACVLLWAAMALALYASAAGQMAGGPNPLPDPGSVSLPDAPLPQTAGPGQANDKDRVTLRNTPVNILRDQAAIWTSPARVREHDFAYLLPLALVTTVAITADHQVMSSSKLNDASLNNHADTASQGLLGGFVAAPVILYGLGDIHHDAHATETGILAGEAMVDSLVVDEVLKAATMRERPTLDGAKGKFFQRSVGLDSSFPSTHSIVAWSSAAVIASEYPGPITEITAYGLAAGLSLTRVLGRQHFPSDVLVGSAVGWMVGRYVYHKHHRATED
jgi:membrane-associated phospholipid phosphatase